MCIFYAKIDYLLIFSGNILCPMLGKGLKKVGFMMKKVVACTREKPLREQIKDDEKYRIEELTVTGFLSDEDYQFLTEMCQEEGRLRLLDLFGVNETDCYRDMENFWHEGDVVISNDVFCDCVRLEKIIFPENLVGIGHYSFMNCENLEEADLPTSLSAIGISTFYNCKKLNEIELPHSNLSMGVLGSHYNFVGCATSFHCSNETWPLNKDGENIYQDVFYGSFTTDGVLFFYSSYDEYIELYKYPSESERTVYETPKDVLEIFENAFTECKNLRVLIVNACLWQSNAIDGCPNLETLIIKSEGAYASGYNSFNPIAPPVIRSCPKLQDIYLYCEEPENMNDLFSQVDGLENIVLHVPCFCAKKYLEHLNVPYDDHYAAKVNLPPLTDEDIRQFNENYPPAWRRFKRIEEFDPVDVFGSEIIEFF